MTRRIVCAALRKDGVLIVGPRHFDRVMIDQIERMGLDMRQAEQGFIDQGGEFLDRRDELAVATGANQINWCRPKTNPVTELFSEDLY
jgi:hypothetical protein